MARTTDLLDAFSGSPRASANAPIELACGELDPAGQLMELAAKVLAALSLRVGGCSVAGLRLAFVRSGRQVTGAPALLSFWGATARGA